MWAPAVVGLPALAREAERQNRIAVIEPLVHGRENAARLVGAALAEAGWNDAAPMAATCIAEIPAQPVRWLWGRRVPLAMPSVCFGPPGQGKSHLGVDICARVSRGSAWPDGGRAPLGNALILSAEDDPATVLRPRLEAAGADLDRVFVLPAVGDFGGERRAFDMRRDAGVLEQTIAAHEAIVAVLDPLGALLGDTDSYRQSDVRVVLAIAADVAARTGAALWCVAHPSKSDSGTALSKLGGSVAFGAAPRSVMSVVPDPDDEDGRRRLFLPVKLNVGKMPAGIGFAICGEDEASARSHLVYDVDPVTVSAEDVLGERKADGPQIAEAKTFLMVALADGAWHPARDLEDEAATKDIGARTLRRARRHLPIECRKGGFDGGWEWRRTTSEAGS